MRLHTRRSLLALLPGLPLAALARPLSLPPSPAASAVPGQPMATGRLEIHEAFASRHVAARNVRVWLPPDHDEGEACDVLYMHDGQNLFAPANPFNHGPWDVDRHLLSLRAQGRVRKTLVVGIDNAGLDRSREYAPQAALERMPRAQRRYGLGPEATPLLGEAYLRFLAKELKPFVDARYRTRRDAAGTHSMGSSMGGLAALHALVRFPRMFGAAACLSTHWPVALGPGMLDPEPSATALAMADAVFDWLRKALPRAGGHRLYFDRGNLGLDALYAPFQSRMDAIAIQKGYRPGQDYESRAFPGANHDEAAWRARLEQPLEFLLGTRS